MFEAYPNAWLFLALLTLAFVGALGYMVLYNLRQKAKLRGSGVQPHSFQEGIAIAQDRSRD